MLGAEVAQLRAGHPERVGDEAKLVFDEADGVAGNLVFLVQIVGYVGLDQRVEKLVQLLRIGAVDGQSGDGRVRFGIHRHIEQVLI